MNNLVHQFYSDRLQAGRVMMKLALLLLLGQPIIIQSNCRHAFKWINNTAYTQRFERIHGNKHDKTIEKLDEIKDFRSNKNYQSLNKTLTILLASDSFDLHSCQYLNKIDNRGDHHLKDQTNMSCYHDDKLDVRSFRFRTIYNRDENAIMRILIDPLMKFNASVIIFASFGWDLKTSQKSYCSQQSHKTSQNNMEHQCLCDSKYFASTNCSAVSNPQVFNRMAIPWCNHEFMNEWQKKYLFIINKIQELSSKTTIFLRNHPPTSSLLAGNPLCLNQMNHFISQLSHDLISSNNRNRCNSSNDDNNNCRLLDMNSLLSSVVPELLSHDNIHYQAASPTWSNYFINQVVDNIII